MGVRIGCRLSSIVVSDASKPSVSWLKIEPRVSIFLVIKSAVAVFITGTTMESLTFGRVFMGVRLEYRLSVIVVYDVSNSSVYWYYYLYSYILNL